MQPSPSSLPVVVVTGTSSGIGLALVKILAHSPYRVVATCRAPKLKETRETLGPDSDRFMLCEMDIVKSSDRERVISTVLDTFGSIDVLINNAGISYRTAVEVMSAEDEQLQMNTNFFGPLNLIKLILPHMRAKRSGRIINVSSVGGMMAMPTMGLYSASKFALEGVSEALWYELSPWQIKVSLVQPGFVFSDGFLHVKESKLLEENSSTVMAYRKCHESMNKFISTWMRRAFATPESIAKRIIGVIEAPDPRLRVPVTFDAYLFSAMRRLLPRRLYHMILYRLLPDIRNWGSY